MPEWMRTSALHDTKGQLQTFSNDAIQLRPGPELSKLKLQCRPDADIDITALEQAVGSKIPRSPQETIGTNPSTFWLAPSEWLITSARINSPVDKHTLHTKLSEVLKGQTHAINDLSDSLTVIELSGEKSRELLAEGCGLDLHASYFQTGSYASIRLFQLPAIIHNINEEPCFRIYVDRSVALHLWSWFVDGISRT
ncbi:hypothetical protein N9A71_06175 [Porticoccaceae bacterium]|nr:hypothetical protein [Porticoccaceae bacterium]